MTPDLCLFPADDVPSTGRSRAHRILAAVEPGIELPAFECGHLIWPRVGLLSA